MEARLLKSLAIVMAIIFAVPGPVAFALNLGTLQKSSAASIASGETAAFRTLFWSTDTEEYTVTINYTEVPKGWLAIVLPKQFQLGGALSGKTERIYLPGTKNTIEAQVVDIYITAPVKTVSGEYEIILDAIAGTSEGAGFSLFQERKLRFEVNVSGISAEENEKNDNRTTFISISPAMDEKPAEKTQALGTISNPPPESDTDWGVPVLIITAISIIAWRLYKYD